jgi:hypothetical protein
MILLFSGFDELEIESDGDVLADENSAGFESGVPREPEVLAINLGRGRETDARVAPRVLSGRGRAFHLNVTWRVTPWIVRSPVTASASSPVRFTCSQTDSY